jgi:hypothetical protein
MTFTLKLNRTNMARIKKNIVKNDQKVEKAALEEWAAEGGAAGTESKVEATSMKVVYRKNEKPPLQRRHRRLLH